MGSAMADRLADPTTTSAPGPAAPVARPPTLSARVEVVLLCLYDAQACRDVLAACPAIALERSDRSSTPRPSRRRRPRSWRRWSVRPGRRTCTRPSWARRPAIAAGRLTILAGGKPRRRSRRCCRCSATRWCSRGRPKRRPSSSSPMACSATPLLSLRRALARGDALGLPRDAVLDVVGRTALGRFVDGRRDVLGERRAPAGDVRGGRAGQGPCPAGVGRRHDVRRAAAAVGALLAAGALGADDDISVAWRRLTGPVLAGRRPARRLARGRRGRRRCCARCTPMP